MSITELGATASSRVGRHFDAATFVPTTLLVTYLATLAASRPWSGSPDWAAAVQTLATIPSAAGLLVASLALALILHPLQFPMTQVLEGYWGVGPLGRRLMAARVLLHRRRRDLLEDIYESAAEKLGTVEIPRDVPEDLAGQVLLRREAHRLLATYPDGRSAMMPTRLGNVLRRFEWQVGAQYGLPVIAVAPHLAMVAPAEQWAYATDQRTALDRAVRLCWLAAAAAVVSAVLLWQDGLWLLMAGIPYCAAYLFYRGAVATAAEYGAVIATILDLNRFALYERLHLKLPKDTELERAANAQLLALLRRGRKASVVYGHAPVAPPPS